MTLSLYDKTGKGIKAEIRKYTYNGTFLGECYITVKIESEIPIIFEIGDYFFFRNEKFVLNYIPPKQKQARKSSNGSAFVYENIKFNSLADELTRVEFLDVVKSGNNIHYTSISEFSFYANNVNDLANRIQANLDRVYPGAEKWTIIVSPQLVSPNKNISVDKINCWDALALASSDFDVNFIIRNRTITIGTAGLSVGKVFGYGKGKGLYDIQQTTNEDAKIVTRLRAYGNTQNIPHKYYNKLKKANGQAYILESAYIPNLMLPSFPYTITDPTKVYIDSATISKYGLREGSVYFNGSEDLPDIYPSLEGMTKKQLTDTGISVQFPIEDNGNIDEIYKAENPTDNGEIPEEGQKGIDEEFTLYLKDLGFDLTEKDADGQYKYATSETMQISMKSGSCIGRTFDIMDKGITKEIKVNQVLYKIRCKRFTDESIAGGTAFPNNNYNVNAGDKFVILGIPMPEVYVKAASQRLEVAAKDYLALHDETKFTYTPRIDEIFMANNPQIGEKIKEGDIFDFDDTDLEIKGSVIIQSLKIDIGSKPVPIYEVTLSNDRITGTIEKIQNAITQLATNNTGVTLEQVKSLILSLGTHHFLSRLNDDSADGNLKFIQNLSVEKDLTVHGDITGKKEIISNQFGNDTFTSGQFGSGFRLWQNAANGQSYAELDNLMVRRETIFNVLSIAEIKSVGGQILVSLANMICSKVETQTDGYKCYFNTDSGKIINQFAVNDQAICRKFNGQSMKYFWRRILSVGIDYVVLSKTDADGSGVPAKGDEIIQFGNRVDRGRQSAILISAYGSDAPSIKQYAGINSYDLTGKEVTVISEHGNKFTGTFTIKSGGSDIRIPADKGIWEANTAYWYYDRVSYNGALWLCVIPDGSLTTEIPSASSTHWMKQVAEGQKGDKGVQGVAGEKGKDGIQYYTWIKYSDNADGTGLYDLPKASTKYIGIAVNKTSATESINKADYIWSLFRGTDGKDGVVDYTTVKSIIQPELNVLDDKIEARVTKTDYNGLVGRVSTTESKIEQQAGQISSTITKVEGKNTVYKSYTSVATDRPSIPYAKGDLWVTYEGEIKQSKNTRVSGSFVDADWVATTKYTDDSTAKAAQTSATNAQTAANNAKTAADNAQTLANTANSKLSEIANDNLLTPSEKQDVLKEWQIIQGEKSVVNAQATTYGIATSVYDTAYNNLNSYITPLLANLTLNSNITGTDFRSKFKAYYDAKIALLKLITDKAKQLADAAQSSANNAQTAANTAQSKANKAESDAATANTKLAEIANDNLLTPSEKQDTLKEWEIIKGEYSTIVVQANTYSVATADYTNKYNALNTYITPLLANLTVNSNIVGSTFRVTFKNYYDAKIALLKLVTDKAKAIADAAQNSANNATNTALKKVRYIRDWLNGSTANTGNHWVQIMAYNAAGTNIALNKTVSGASSDKRVTNGNTDSTSYVGTATGLQHLIVDLGSVQEIQKIKVWHYYADGRTYYATKTECSIDGVNWFTVFDSAVEGTYKETSAGYLIYVTDSAKNADNSTKNRTYYSDTTPAVPEGGHRVGDLWYKISLTDGYYTTYRWNGSTWQQINVYVSKSRIEQTDSRITSVVEKTGINSLGNGETLFSKINQTDSKISLEVNKIQIGARNLIPYTNMGVSGWGYTVQNGTNAFTEVSTLGVRAVRSTTTVASTGYHVITHVINRSLIKNNTQYTLSLDMLPTYDGTMAASIRNGNGQNTLVTWSNFSFKKNVWNRVVLTATSNSDTTTGQILYLTGFNVVGNVVFANLQIEEGNKVSTWSPSPDDIAQIAGSSLTLTDNKISLGSKTIELNGNTIAKAIQAQDFSVKTSDGSSVFEVQNNGRFYSKSVSGNQSLEIDSQSRKIEFKNSQSIYTETNGIKAVTQTTKIDASNGTFESRDSDYNTAYMSSQGIFANRAGISPYSAVTGINLKASIAGLGYGAMNKSYFSNWGLVGVFGRASNSSSNPAPAYGGWFDTLKANGLVYGVRRISYSTTLNQGDVYVSCYNTSDINLWLPSNPYEGTFIMIRRVNNSNIHIYGNGKQIHVDGNLHNDLWHKNGRGDTSIVIFDGQYWMFNYWVR